MSSAATGPLAGRVAVVTGATSGIGRQVALELARMAATTVVVGRGEGRASRAAADIASMTGNPQVESLRVDDLAVISDNRELAASILDRFPAVHILVNNAGGYFRRRELTADGLERTFALNVLSPYLLTTLLAPRMVSSAPARIVNVSSEAHRGGRVDFTDLQSSRKYAGFTVYGNSKLELMWLTREFARRLGGKGVTVNAVHPGYVRSGFGLNNGGSTAFFMRILARLFARSVVRGADTVTYCASAPELASVTGDYYFDRKPIPGTDDSRDLAKARRLFDECTRLSGLPPLVG
ncbi:MAG TPA: SDR family oxidoreductase [Thermoplasmata archaeon]|nr:SDR family oxidoreductase [Thermoplasmata archaeon]